MINWEGKDRRSTCARGTLEEDKLEDAGKPTQIKTPVVRNGKQSHSWISAGYHGRRGNKKLR